MVPNLFLFSRIRPEAVRKRWNGFTFVFRLFRFHFSTILESRAIREIASQNKFIVLRLIIISHRRQTIYFLTKIFLDETKRNWWRYRLIMDQKRKEENVAQYYLWYSNDNRLWKKRIWILEILTPFRVLINF